MRTLKNKVSIAICMLLLAFAFATALFCINASPQVAYAFAPDEIFATYLFTRLNDTDCDVRIANKDSATRANIPSHANIDGKEYNVTEVALNGFTSSTKLKHVTLPPTIRKIGNTAFANCTELKTIFLANVESIGNNAFMRCTSLEGIVIPKSVTSMGTTVFRNCNTYVRVRANEDELSWTSNWNTNNGVANVEYGSTYIEPIMLDPIYNITYSRSVEVDSDIIGYAVSGGQPYAEEFYNDEIIRIPAVDPETGKPILEISAYSLCYSNFSQLIVEYSDIPISIESGAFWGCVGNNITINREINYIDPNNETGVSDNIFTDSDVSTIVLPESIPGLCAAMFFECTSLRDIHFVKPIQTSDEENIVKNLTSTRVVTLPNLDTFTHIGESAFYSTNEISKLIIPENVINVESKIIDGWNNNQIVDIGFTCGQLPTYNSNDKTGWHLDYNSGSDAQILFVRYRVMFDAGGGSIVGSDYIDVERNSSIGTLPTANKSNAVFGGWFTGQNGSGIQYVESSKLQYYDNITLYARWDLTATFNSNGGSNVAIIIGTPGQTITLPSPILDGYNGYWRNNSNNQRYEFGAKYVFGTASISFTAVWSEKSFSELYNNGSYEIWTDRQLQYVKEYATNNYTFSLMKDFNISGTWDGIPEFNGVLVGNDHTISYQNVAVPYGKNYGFISVNNGTVRQIHFKPNISVIGKASSSDPTLYAYVGGAVGVNNGYLYRVFVEKTIDNPYMTLTGEYDIDIYAHNVFSLNLGGICGLNNGEMDICSNYASLGGGANIGGIVGINDEASRMLRCSNRGDIFFNHSNNASVRIGGVVGTARDKGYIENCTNWAYITWAARLSTANNTSPAIARLAASVCSSVSDVTNGAYGKVIISDEVQLNLTTMQLQYVKDEKFAVVFDPPGSSSGSESSCIAKDTMITLADGSLVPVESLTGNEMLLVWNMYIGQFEAAPILFIDKDPAKIYKVINLTFSDGTGVKIISEHAFWDFDLNRYVYLDENASQYIGHWFNKHVNENGVYSWTRVQLINVEANYEVITVYSPVTYGHLCYYVNGMLSMPGGINGLFNIFEVNPETMTYDGAAMNADVAKYGLFTYDEFAELVPVAEEIFNAVNGQYLKIAIGKGLITIKDIQKLVDRYSIFFE